MLSGTDTPETPAAQAKRKPKAKRPPLPSTHGRMLRRLNELRALAHDRIDHNEPVGDLDKWAMLLADCLLHHTKGLDYYVFRDTLRTVPALHDALDEDTIMAAIHKITRTAKWKGKDYGTIRTTTAGQWLNLTTAERQRCEITTLRAVDETGADAKAERLL